jgi:hypothetical protein
MELEGNLILERRPARRWVSALAVVVPVLLCLAGVTWFVRAFISPPTITIPSPMSLAAAPPAPPVRAEPPAASPPAPVEAPADPAPAQASPAQPWPAETSGSAAAQSVFPPVPPREPVTTAFADPGRNPTAGAAPASAAATGIDAAPIAGPIPLPRARPHETVAVASAAVPLPRPRPAEETGTPAAQTTTSQPNYVRHSAE